MSAAPHPLDAAKADFQDALADRRRAYAAWKGFGNAIVPPLAAEVLAALSETLPEWRS
jgi:hypothetical protein